MDPRQVALDRERRSGETVADAAAALRQQRQARNLTQAQVAAKLGVTPNTVARWERAEVPIPDWVRLFLKTESRLSAELAGLQKELANHKDEIATLKEKVRQQAKELTRMDELKADMKATQKQMKEIGDRIRGRRA